MDLIRIAIDGPSGSGKSTAAKNLARELGLEYVDTGAMYRAAAYKANKLGVDVKDDGAVTAMLSDTDIDFSGGSIYLDGENIDDKIRTIEISSLASEISKLPGCRARLVDIQRKIGAGKSVVMDGRDIGTNVFPDAEYKFFITASLDVRALRRYSELRQAGQDVDLSDVTQDLYRRDENDKNRAVNPLRKAKDAIEFNTDGQTIEHTTQALLSYIKK